MPHISLRSDLFGITSLLDFRKDAAKPLCALTHLLLRGASSLTESERELIAAYVSSLNDCRYCSTAHTAATCMLPEGEQTGMKPLLQDMELLRVSPKMKSLLKLASKVRQGGHYVEATDIDAAKEYGATDLEIHDTVLISALFCLYNRYVDGLAAVTPDDPSYYTSLAKRITSRGYLMPEDGYQPLPT